MSNTENSYQIIDGHQRGVDPQIEGDNQTTETPDRLSHLIKNVRRYLFGEESLETKVPKINFSAIPIYRSPKKIEIKGELANAFEIEISEVLSEQYSIISAILGLDKIADNYDFIITEIDSEGEHEPIKNLKRGQILISKNLTIQAASRLELEKKSKINNQKTAVPSEFEAFRSLPIVHLIEALAHELYHKRQALLFNAFYEKRRARYVSPLTDTEKYEKQLMEIGARAFAKRYIQKLHKSLLDNDQSYLADSIRNYINIIDTTETENNMPIEKKSKVFEKKTKFLDKGTF